MAYTSQTQILGYISYSDLIGLTDDQQTGDINQTVLTQVCVNVSSEIDAMLASIYDVPFTNPPEAVTAAATVMACAALYRRRLTPEERNSFADDDRKYRNHFRAVGKGEEELDAKTFRAFNPGVVQSTGSVLCGFGLGCNGPIGGAYG